MDAAVQESLLAVPYALGRLGANKQSLEHYEKAIVLYNKEIVRLTSSIHAIGSGKLVESLLQQNPEDEMGWFWRLQDIPDAPESHYLLYLMAGHDFQESLKNYRDLNFLSRNLENWSENIHIHEVMLDTRRRAFTERLPKVVRATETSNLARLKTARDRHVTELTQIERDEDALALATDAQKRQWQQLQKVEQRLGSMTADSATRAAQDKHRLMHGLLQWDMAAEYKPRLRETKKELNELDRAVAEASARRDNVQRALVDAPKEFEAFAKRIQALRARIAQRQTEVAAAAREQQVYIQNIAMAELEQQRRRLAEYLTQAQFAVSQIHDQSLIPNVEQK